MLGAWPALKLKMSMTATVYRSCHFRYNPHFEPCDTYIRVHHDPLSHRTMNCPAHNEIPSDVADMSFVSFAMAFA